LCVAGCWSTRALVPRIMGDVDCSGEYGGNAGYIFWYDVLAPSLLITLYVATG
jgi:hypothetical protein